jgi:hypothetical protein
MTKLRKHVEVMHISLVLKGVNIPDESHTLGGEILKRMNSPLKIRKSEI